LRGLFPQDVFGGTNREEEAPRKVRVYWGGEPVETDLVATDGAFRARGWIAEFFRLHGLGAGDRVVVERVGDYACHVYPLRLVGLGIQPPDRGRRPT
jgi:hypothetical protein